MVCGDVLKVLAGKVCPPKMEDQGGEKREGEEKEREKTEEGEESDSKGVSSSSSTVNSLVLSRLIFTAGHVAQWQVQWNCLSTAEPLYTVEPLNNGHIGMDQVVLFQKNVLPLYGLLHSLYSERPLSEVPRCILSGVSFGGMCGT